jgi:hypothetical protein
VGVVKELADQAQPPYEIEWVEKIRDLANRRWVNRQQANEIIAMVHAAISRAQLVEA